MIIVVSEKYIVKFFFIIYKLVKIIMKNTVCNYIYIIQFHVIIFVRKKLSNNLKILIIMNINTYELALVTSPELRAEEIDALISTFGDSLKEKKSKLIHIDKWGIKKLSYPINNFIEASYTFVIFESPPSDIKEIKQWINNNNSILRYLLIKLTHSELKHREDNLLNPAVNN